MRLYTSNSFAVSPAPYAKPGYNVEDHALLSCRRSLESSHEMHYVRLRTVRLDKSEHSRRPANSAPARSVPSGCRWRGQNKLSV
jgi:hypothetical protein